MKYRDVLSILFIGYLLLYFFSKIYPDLIRVHYSFGIGLILNALLLKSFKRDNFKIILIIFFLATFSFLNNYFRGNFSDLTYSLLMFTFPGFVFAIKEKRIKARYVQILLYLYFAYIVINAFIFGVDFNELIPGGSRNYVGWLSLYLCILYYFISINNGSRFGLTPAAINLFTSIILQGRAGIVVSSLLLGAIIYEIYFKKVSVKRIFVFVILASLIAAIAINFAFFFSEKFSYFEEKGLDLGGRDLIWLTYFNAIANEPVNIIFGVSRFYRSEFEVFNNNFHNSFVLGHSYFGILFIPFILYFLFLIIKNSRKHFLVSFMAILLLARAFTDSLLFIQNLDLLVYSILNFFILVDNNKRPVA